MNSDEIIGVLLVLAAFGLSIFLLEQVNEMQKPKKKTRKAQKRVRKPTKN